MLELMPYLLAAAAGGIVAGIVVGARAARRPASGLQLSNLKLPKQNFAELQRFRAVVDTCVDSIYMVDRETLKFVDATATASSRTGYSHEELMRMGPLDLLTESREELIRNYDAAIAAGAKGIRTESAGRLKDGSETFVELNRQAVQIDGRWIIVTISRDVTERKRAEHAAQRFARMFAALSDTNEAIMRVSSPEDLYQRVCEAAVHGGRLLAASICVPGEHSADARIAAVAGAGAERLRDVHLSIDGATPEGRGLIGTAFRA
jgi:PAS domain S-box-containing protein